MKNFKRRSELPEQTILFKLDNQIIVETAIEVLNAHGVPVYLSTLEDGYDNEYPYLLWDRHHITQVAIDYMGGCETICSTLDEFFSYFFESTRKTKDIRISDQYKATVMADNIVVGCQTIDFDTVERVYNAMLELRKQK